MVPPWARTMARAMVSPRPLPLPSGTAARRVGTVEAVEDALERVDGDPRPVVGHRDRDGAPLQQGLRIPLKQHPHGNGRAAWDRSRSASGLAAVGSYG